MINRTTNSSVAALVLARTLQFAAKDQGDRALMDYAKKKEQRALAAIREHNPILPPKPFQLRLPGI